MGLNAIRPDTDKTPRGQYEYIRVINILSRSSVNIDLYFFDEPAITKIHSASKPRTDGRTLAKSDIETWSRKIVPTLDPR
jgi:hypothetical protein